MSTAMEVKQTSYNVNTTGLEFMTAYPAKMLGFSAVLVSQCFLMTHRTAKPLLKISTLFIPRES